MKTFLLKFSAFAFIAMIVAVTFTSTSCNKDKTCHGTVTVVDTTSAKVAGATVLLAAPSVGGQITYTGTTDGTGVVNFDVKLPAIFDVTATKTGSPTKTGTGIIRLDEAGKSNSVTITVH